MHSSREKCVALIQARMSSRRLPGKVLLPLGGRPLLEHVVQVAAAALSKGQVIVATSDHASDDPVANFCSDRGLRCSRGSLENVVWRLQQAVGGTGADSFFRICADSPFYDADLMRRALDLYQNTNDVDLVTNVFPRSFPKGHSIELARTSTFLALQSKTLSEEEREHVFLHYYRNEGRYKIHNFRSSQDDSIINLCVDTEDDWKHAEAYLQSGSTDLRKFFGEKSS